MIFRVIVTERAGQDLQEIYSYIHERSPQGAERVYESIMATIWSLDRHPLRFPIAPEDQTLVGGARHASEYPYRIVFVVRGPEVRIIGIRHGARLPMGVPSPKPNED